MIKNINFYEGSNISDDAMEKICSSMKKYGIDKLKGIK